jgi:hypothetical protein
LPKKRETENDMTINPKATYRIGKLRSDSRASDPDPVLIQAKTIPGSAFTMHGIMEWQQFFTANPLAYKNNTSLDVFQVSQRGELKHVYSGTILSGFGQGFDPGNGMGMNQYGGNGGYNPTPIGGGSSLANSMQPRSFGGNTGEHMEKVFSHAELSMHNMQMRHEAELDRLNTYNADLRTELTRLMEKNAIQQAELNSEREKRINTEKEKEMIKQDFELREKYSKLSDENAIKLAHEKLVLDKKSSNALSDGSLENIMGLMSKGTEFLKVLNGQPTQNQMQPSVPTTGTYGGVSDAHAGQAAKQGMPPFQPSKVMNIAPQPAPAQQPRQPFANVEYQ